jgi:hypothetical protein
MEGTCPDETVENFSVNQSSQRFWLLSFLCNRATFHSCHIPSGSFFLAASLANSGQPLSVIDGHWRSQPMKLLDEKGDDYEDYSFSVIAFG